MENSMDIATKYLFVDLAIKNLELDLQQRDTNCVRGTEGDFSTYKVIAGKYELGVTYNNMVIKKNVEEVIRGLVEQTTH